MPGARGPSAEAYGDIDLAAILSLSIEERLRLIELIRASVTAEPSAGPPSEADRAIIDECLAEHARNPDDIVTREHVLDCSTLLPSPRMP